MDSTPANPTFRDFYRETFATFGLRLCDEDGFADSDIKLAEQRLEIELPISLKEYYLVAGREKRINQFHDRLLPPEKLFTDSGRLVFMEENQCVVYWGTTADQVVKTDAQVFHGLNCHDSGIEWHPEHDSCFTFLTVMAVWHASFGGAAANTAVGYVEEQITRETLDGQWQFVGEVNAMRAYTQSGRAVCFLKWEDAFQKKLGLPAWRIFVAGASEDDLEQIRRSLRAEWDEWGA